VWHQHDNINDLKCCRLQRSCGQWSGEVLLGCPSYGGRYWFSASSRLVCGPSAASVPVPGDLSRRARPGRVLSSRPGVSVVRNVVDAAVVCRRAGWVILKDTFAVWNLSDSRTSVNILASTWIGKRTWLVISTALSKLKDLSR